MKIKKSIYKIPRNVNPIQDGVGRGAKSPLPTSFSPITSTNVRLSWSNPCKIEVVITSLIEMLELPNLGHMTTSAI